MDAHQDQSAKPTAAEFDADTPIATVTITRFKRFPIPPVFQLLPFAVTARDATSDADTTRKSTVARFKRQILTDATPTTAACVAPAATNTHVLTDSSPIDIPDCKLFWKSLNAKQNRSLSGLAFVTCLLRSIDEPTMFPPQFAFANMSAGTSNKVGLRFSCFLVSSGSNSSVLLQEFERLFGFPISDKPMDECEMYTLLKSVNYASALSVDCLCIRLVEPRYWPGVIHDIFAMHFGLAESSTRAVSIVNKVCRFPASSSRSL